MHLIALRGKNPVTLSSPNCNITLVFSAVSMHSSVYLDWLTDMFIIVLLKDKMIYKHSFGCVLCRLLCWFSCVLFTVTHPAKNGIFQSYESFSALTNLFQVMLCSSMCLICIENVIDIGSCMQIFWFFSKSPFGSAKPKLLFSRPSSKTSPSSSLVWRCMTRVYGFNQSVNQSINYFNERVYLSKFENAS